MPTHAIAQPPAERSGTRKPPPTFGKRLWKKLRGPLRNSRFLKNALAWLIAGLIRLVDRTNPPVPGSHDPDAAIGAHAPFILALWHGQHFLLPALLPQGREFAALVSRSADAEINALVAEKLGCTIVRGSGGRAGVRGKGGARALLALKRILEEGGNVAMIADVPNGTPREAGQGIVALARLSGRPIIPAALATSRHKVLEKSWDKATLNLPFGRKALVVGAPVEVPADADATLLEEKRASLTRALDEATCGAYSLVGRAP